MTNEVKADTKLRRERPIEEKKGEKNNNTKRKGTQKNKRKDEGEFIRGREKRLVSYKKTGVFGGVRGQKKGCTRIW